MDNTVVTTEQGKVVIDEVEKLANKYVLMVQGPNFDRQSLETLSRIENFKEGYKASQQKGTYSEEDIRKAVIFGQSSELTFVTDKGKEILTKDFIKSLK